MYSWHQTREITKRRKRRPKSVSAWAFCTYTPGCRPAFPLASLSLRISESGCRKRASRHFRTERCGGRAIGGCLTRLAHLIRDRAKLQTFGSRIIATVLQG